MRATLLVVDPGPPTTVQDLGRFGYQGLGVPVSGAMDLWALRALNRLVGNPDGAAGLEATLVGPTLVVEAAPGHTRPSGGYPGSVPRSAGPPCRTRRPPHGRLPSGRPRRL